jgi:hypothetical protein
LGKLIERENLEDLDTDRRIILNPASRNRMGAFTGLIWLKIGQLAGSCQHSSETSSVIKCGKFLEWLRNCWLLKNDSAAWS